MLSHVNLRDQVLFECKLSALLALRLALQALMRSSLFKTRPLIFLINLDRTPFDRVSPSKDRTLVTLLRLPARASFDISDEEP